jgi:hypothetical protein
MMRTSEPPHYGAAVISESAAAEKVECGAGYRRRPPCSPPFPWLSQVGARGIVPGRMDSRLFLPTARQTNWLLLIGLLALGEALYLRYLAIEYAQVSLACQAGLDTWLCATFRLVIILYNHSVFGWIALAAAVLNLIRPSIVLVAVALAAAAFGLVLHNANLAGVAAALLILSLARPAPAAE